MSWSLLLPFVLFVAGVGMVIWATERLLEGLVGLAYLARVLTFAIAAVLSRRCGTRPYRRRDQPPDGLWHCYWPS